MAMAVADDDSAAGCKVIDEAMGFVHIVTFIVAIL
jgi:hypothetical protein